MGTAIGFIILIKFFIAFFHFKNPKNIDVFFPAESIGTLSFAVQTRFSGEKLNFSVLNAKYLKKFIRRKPIEAASGHKNISKNFMARFFFTF